jgi:predicted transcriptional regulator
MVRDLEIGDSPVSYKLVDKVFDVVLPSSEKQVLGSLARHAHNDGSEARPCVQTIMRETGLSERTVQRALRKLETRGWIADANPDKGKKGGKKPVNYRLIPGKWGVIVAPTPVMVTPLPVSHRHPTPVTVAPESVRQSVQDNRYKNLSEPKPYRKPETAFAFGKTQIKGAGREDQSQGEPNASNERGWTEEDFKNWKGSYADFIRHRRAGSIR